MLYILTLMTEDGRITDQEIFSQSPTRDTLISIEADRWELRSGNIDGGDTTMQTNSDIFGG